MFDEVKTAALNQLCTGLHQNLIVLGCSEFVKMMTNLLLLQPAYVPYVSIMLFDGFKLWFKVQDVVSYCNF